MALESASFLNQLVSTNPSGTDKYSTADDHLRLIKACLVATFPNASAAINPAVAEFNYLVGVTSAIQTQLNAKEATANKNASGGYAGLTGLALNAAITVACSALTGTLADARVVASNVTQHQAALSIATTQLTGVLAAAQEPAHTGDVTNSASSLALTIAGGAVSLAKMANLAANSIIGNNTGSAATPLALTTAQVKTLLAISSGDVSGLAASATTDTTNAANISSGVIPSARVTTIDAACTVNGFTVGYRQIPRSTTATTFAIGDVDKCVAITATINIPASVFAAGDAISVYNDSAGALTITISAGTLRLAGTTTTGTRTLAARGMCTLWFNVGGATPEVICGGAGVT